MEKGPKPIVEKGGCAIYEIENDIILVNRRTSTMFTLNFVLLLVGIICVANGTLLITSYVLLSSILLLVSGLCFFLFYKVFLKLRKAKTIPPNEKTTIAIMDLEKRLFLNPQRKVIAPLEEVHFSKGFQFTSSSPSILAKWGSGRSKVIFKFNGLIGGSDLFISYFKRKGYWS